MGRFLCTKRYCGYQRVMGTAEAMTLRFVSWEISQILFVVTDFMRIFVSAN